MRYAWQILFVPLVICKPADIHAQSAPLAAWTVERAKLPRGGKACVVVSTGHHVRVVLLRITAVSRTQVHVKVGFENQPGSLRYLRVGRKIFQTARDRFTGREAAYIVKQLQMSSEFAFEWFRRPDFAKQNGLYQSGEFAKGLSSCRGWIAGTDA